MRAAFLETRVDPAQGGVGGRSAQVADLEFVNGGGTGSIESTAADSSVTEVAAGSGLFGPHLFDHYAHFRPAPAAAFALSVVRKPRPEMAVISGGGWMASGLPAADRAPQLAWPQGLSMVPREMAGEVQTPLTGPGAAALVDGSHVAGSIPSYRGEGKMFL